MIKCELLVTCVLCFTFVMATEVREAKARPEGWVEEAEWWSAASCSAAWGSSSHQGRRIFFWFSDKSHKLGVLLNLWRNTLTRDLVQWFTHWCWPWQGWNYSEWGHWEHLSPPPTMAQRWDELSWVGGGGGDKTWVWWQPWLQQTAKMRQSVSRLGTFLQHSK